MCGGVRDFFRSLNSFIYLTSAFHASVHSGSNDSESKALTWPGLAVSIPLEL